MPEDCLTLKQNSMRILFLKQAQMSWVQSYTCNLVSRTIFFGKLKILDSVFEAHHHFSLLQRFVDGWLANISIVCKDKKNYAMWRQNQRGKLAGGFQKTRYLLSTWRLSMSELYYYYTFNFLSFPIQDIPLEQPQVQPTSMSDLQKRILKSEAALSQKEEENTALREQLRQFEERWSEYDIKMKSMEETWQKQMSSLQVKCLPGYESPFTYCISKVFWNVFASCLFADESCRR